MPKIATIRPIKKIWKSEPTIEGAGVRAAFEEYQAGTFVKKSGRG